MVLPIFEGEAAEVRLDHEENLKLCDLVLIYYGAANELWLRAKLRDLQKIAGYGRAEPLLAKAIYAGAPQTPQKERFRTRDALLIKHYEPFAPDTLTPFLTEFEQTQGGQAG